MPSLLSALERLDSEQWIRFEKSFFSRVYFTTGCWEWTGARNPMGYGQIVIPGWPIRSGRVRYAHRISYIMLVGDLDEKLSIDHLCRNPPCLRPEHLEAVTHRTNALRGISPAANKSRQTVCIHGHPLTPENVWIRKEGWRQCRQCKSRRDREYQARLRLNRMGD